MAINPQMLAAVMQRMQPQGGPPPGMNAPMPPAPPPPGGPMGQPSPGMPVQMQGTMMMKPAQPSSPAQGQDGQVPGFGRPGTGLAPPRQF